MATVIAGIQPIRTSVRQQLLFLWLTHPNPASECIAWSLFDGASEAQHTSGDQEEPPYPTLLAAMQDGWRVIQVAQQETPALGLEQRTAYLPYWFALERMVDLATDSANATEHAHV